MICLFPFTHISDPRAGLLAEALGPVTVCLPLDSMASSQMKAWGRHGLMEIRTPAGLDGSALMATLREFKQWAAIHGTKLSDISDFYRLSQGRPPLVDENGPGRILTQIRRRESGTAMEAPDRLFSSALILALAHDHDKHQDEAHRQLGSVEAMEAELYADMSGKREGVDFSASPGPDAAATAALQERDVRMSARRLQAWACLAQSSPPVPPVFVTSSSAILEHLLERDAMPIQPVYWELGDSDGTMALKQQRLEALDACGRSNDPLTVLSDHGLAGEPGPVRLALHVVPGVTPPDLLSGLSNMPAKTQEGHGNVWINSIVGLIASG